MRSITSGEHWGNVIVCSSLLTVFLPRHPSVALALATPILMVTAIIKEINVMSAIDSLFWRKRDFELRLKKTLQQEFVTLGEGFTHQIVQYDA